MSALDSSKLRLVAGIVVVAGAIALVIAFSGGRDPDPPTTLPVPVAPEPELPQALPPAPPESPPAPGPVPADPAPTPAAAPAATATAGAVSEMLVVSRRIESTDPRRSRQLLNDVLASDPDNVTALERLSKKMVSDEDAHAARELLERCLKVDQRNAECAAMKASMVTEPPAESSVAQAQACLAQNNQAIECNYTMADSALYDGKKEAAMLISMKMHKENPDAPATKLALGRVKAAYGEYSQALPLLQAACDLGDKDGCFRANLLKQEGF